MVSHRLEHHSQLLVLRAGLDGFQAGLADVHMADPVQVGDEIPQPLPVFDDGGQVQVHGQTGVVQPLDQGEGVGGAVEEVGVPGGVGLDGQTHPVPGGQAARLVKEGIRLVR